MSHQPSVVGVTAPCMGRRALRPSDLILGSARRERARQPGNGSAPILVCRVSGTSHRSSSLTMSRPKPAHPVPSLALLAVCYGVEPWSELREAVYRASWRWAHAIRRGRVLANNPRQANLARARQPFIA
jgi:hypothetical protein